MLSRVRCARSNRNGIFFLFYFFEASQSDADSAAALTSRVFERLIVCLLFSNPSCRNPVNSRESPEVRERGEKCVGLRTLQSRHICGISSRYFRVFFCGGGWCLGVLSGSDLPRPRRTAMNFMTSNSTLPWLSAPGWTHTHANKCKDAHKTLQGEQLIFLPLGFWHPGDRFF